MGYEILWWNNLITTSNVFTVKWESREDEVRFRLKEVEFNLIEAENTMQEALTKLEELESSKKKLISQLS